MLTVPEIIALKGKRPLSMVTCYEAWTAKIIDKSPVDMVLVGDSVGMVVHGFDSTVPVTMEMMELHTKAVARAMNNKFIVGDLPFLSFRQGIKQGTFEAGLLMRAGAHAVKLEGADGNLKLVHHLVQSGIPVMGHLGLTPQSVHQLGGFKVQAREEAAAKKLLEQASQLEQAGCFALVLECVPQKLARVVTEKISIPTIGIGAGPEVNGQVLVLHDLIGADGSFKPKFVRRFADIQSPIENALNEFCDQIMKKTFPNAGESYD